jgi:hypothetical protein
MRACFALVLLGGCGPAADDRDDTAIPDTDDTHDTGDDTNGDPPPVTDGQASATYNFGQHDIISVVAGWAAGEAADELVLTLQVGAGPDAAIDVSFDHCFMPAFRLVDEGGTTVFEGTDPLAGDCPGPTEERFVAPEATVTAGFVVGGLAPGVYTLTATQALRATDRHDPVISTGDMFPWALTTTLRVGEGAPYPKGVETTFPNGVAMQFAAGDSVVAEDDGRVLDAAGVPAFELGGVWGDCGAPRYWLTEPDGNVVWTASLADAMDCFQVKGWPAGEERDGAQSVGDDGLQAEVRYTATAGFRWTDGSADFMGMWVGTDVGIAAE